MNEARADAAVEAMDTIYAVKGEKHAQLVGVVLLMREISSNLTHYAACANETFAVVPNETLARMAMKGTGLVMDRHNALVERLVQGCILLSGIPKESAKDLIADSKMMAQQFDAALERGR